MAQISALARNFIVSRMLDTEAATRGFNYWASILPGSPIYPDIEPFQLVLGENLFVTHIEEAEIDETEIDSSYPLVIIFSDEAVDGGDGQENSRLTPSLFSGPTTTIIDYYMSFETADLPAVGEEFIDFAEDAMTETFNSYQVMGLWQQTSALSYNCRMTWKRDKLSSGGLNWRQKIRFIIIVSIPDAQPNLVE